MQNASLFPIWLLNLIFFSISSILKCYLTPAEHHSACLNNGCALLAGRDMKARIILFVCHLQMNLRVVSVHVEQKMSLVVLMLSSIAAVKGITIAAAKEHYLLNPGVSLCAFSSALSMPRWCVGLLNRSRFNHKWEWDQAQEMQPSVLYS